MVSEKFENKAFYTTNQRLYLFNTIIYEYDIHSADVNICRYYKILSDNDCDKLESLDKHRRVRQVGIFQKKAEFRDKLTEGFAKIRREFYDANDLNDDDIIAVKKDAIFTTKPCYSLIFGPVKFIEKNRYTSFVKLNNLELYYAGEYLDVKGIDNDILKKHEDGMMNLIINYFRKMEIGTTPDVLTYMNRQASRYKHRMLPIEYYRQFNSDSKYAVLGSEDTYDDYWDDKANELDISYNFMNIIIPLTKIAL